MSNLADFSTVEFSHNLLGIVKELLNKILGDLVALMEVDFIA